MSAAQENIRTAGAASRLLAPVGIAVAAALFFWTQFQTGAQNEQNLIDDLPALEARVATLESRTVLDEARILELQNRITELLASTLTTESIRQEFADFQNQLDRRDAEQSNDLDATRADLNGDIDVLRALVVELEDDLEALEREGG